MKTSFTKQLRLLARRSIARTWRDPASVVPAFAIPILLYVVISAGMSGVITKVKGFPTNNFATFAFTLLFANGAMAIIGSTGQNIATDIETNFLDRLVLTPLRGSALLVAQLAGVISLALLQATVFFGLGFAYGAHIEAGITGAVVVVALFLTGVIGFGLLGLYIGLKTASGQAVQGIAPVMLVFLFLSSVLFPRNLIDADWFRWIATVNPLSYFVEGIRSLFIYGWRPEALGLGFAVAGGLVVLMVVASAFALRGRLAR